MVCCDVYAVGSVQVTVEQFPSLRRSPGPGLPESFSATGLKHSDEQSVAALAAVLQAIQQTGMPVANFSSWGIVAAPCFIGRSTLVVALQRYAQEGAWGISPHFIPHCSQHSASGTISQVLKIHGPNFGVGGGSGGILEALLAGATLVKGNGLPGVWVVITGWDPEWIPDQDGRPTTNSVCQALALALTTAQPGRPS
jgi:3-oxoacyl-(acyl-carrier-protein) synthase